MKVSKRIIPFLLAFAIFFSALPVASASGSSEILVDAASVNAWNSRLAAEASWWEKESEAQSEYWTNMDHYLSTLGIGSMSSYSDITMIVAGLEMCGPGLFGTIGKIIDGAFFRLWNTPDYVVMYDDSLGVWRPYDNKTQLWVVNSRGHFPYYMPDGTEDDPADPDAAAGRIGQWLDMQKVGAQTVLWHIASNYELNEFKEQWIDLYPEVKIVESGSYYWLVRSDSRTAYVLCDKYGYPYYLPKPDETAVSTPNNYYTDQGDTYIDDDSTTVNVYDDGAALVGSPIDINNGIINVGGEIYYIDELTYDASTQTYYVDAHDEYVYNSTTNNYTTNSYSFKFEYYVDYTSVTYIGQTEEYQERYEYYYQLPDGRSSADLTAEDLEQLSMVFKDVVQYARAADNSDLRVLYHFDGSTEDSSYWSYITEFDWGPGASLTYMDEGTFNGSLYLDETLHRFDITLPSETDVYGDFTLQFRYYQSHSASPSKDSFVSFGAEPVLWFDGQYYYDRAGDIVLETSVGTWNELCIMRSGDTIYYYVNGVFLNRVTDSTLFENVIQFYFGSPQETYKKLDELRFTRAAVYTPGEDYTPSSVPFDTNLTLILPEGEVPVADEVLVINPAKDNLLGFSSMDGWTNRIKYRLKEIDDSLVGSSFEDFLSNNPLFIYAADYTTMQQYPDRFHLEVSGSTATETIYLGDASASFAGGDLTVLRNGLFLPVLGFECSGNGSPVCFSDQEAYYPVVSDGGTYTLSVVLVDGTYSSVTFTVNGAAFVIDSTVDGCPVQFTAETIKHMQRRTVVINDTEYVQHYHAEIGGINILPTSDSVDIRYLELVEGTEPGFDLAWEVAVYSSEDLEGVPVLAVRTNNPITGYQIGGVRPSYPVKGLVYAMVENSRIVSLQLYDGSAWTSVDGRIWTGKRWIPCGSFDVLTLKDYHDVIGASDPEYEYIYSESGFWAWFQRQWIIFMDKVDQIIDALTGGSGAASDCDHVYNTDIGREATCTVPGYMTYTCDHCGHKYTESVDAFGHDWILDEHVDDVLDEDGNVVEEGYDLLRCSVCGIQGKDYGSGILEQDIFDAIGDLLADGIDWILDKLGELSDSLTSITETFHDYVEQIKAMPGEYTMFFGAFLSLLPEDLMLLLWFGVIAAVVVAVWLAWTR